MPADQNLIREKKLRSLFRLLFKMAPQSAYYYAVQNGGFEASLKERQVHTQNTTVLMIK